MNIAEFVAVHVSRLQGGVAHADVAVVVVGAERAHLPETRTTDAARVAHLELVVFVHRIVQVRTRKEIDVRLAAVDGIGAVVGIAFQVREDIRHFGTHAHLSRPATPVVAEAGIKCRHLFLVFVVVAVVGQRTIHAKAVSFSHFR